MWSPVRGSVVLVAGVLVLAACGAAPPSTASAPSPSSAVASTALPTAPPSIAPVASSTSPGAFRTFPPEQSEIEPGLYRWEEFAPPISLTIGAGWEIGHRHPEFFDVWLAGDFPAISFGRFTHVFTDATQRVASSDSAAVVASLSDHPGLDMSAPRPVDMAGLSGQQIDVQALEPRTPVFGGATGVLHADPEFQTRYTILDLPQGEVLAIGIVAREGDLDRAIEAANPLLVTLVVALD